MKKIMCLLFLAAGLSYYCLPDSQESKPQTNVSEETVSIEKVDVPETITEEVVEVVSEVNEVAPVEMPEVAVEENKDLTKEEPIEVVKPTAKRNHFKSFTIDNIDLDQAVAESLQDSTRNYSSVKKKPVIKEVAKSEADDMDSYDFEMMESSFSENE